ncbi:S41 family peptidase [Dysgonomonas sp. 25]|uniref:S41 family peptidase n=1 Tax=Dysgonomonas sp. 25 TaxID=2302933 RepID=UPI0013D45FF3|nr:S41 family peptidase [Dysgonomonas sp. 25]NDV67426.1 S41 family peptidase [Dysgonomonas sp. 25]
MKIKLVFSAVFVLLFAGITTLNAQEEKNKEQERYFEINKNIDIFNTLLRELDMFYVDSIDLQKTVKAGIDNMLYTLDPYTEYYDEEATKQFTTMTTGEYAGVGAGILYKDDRIIFSEPFEGKPAAKAGIKAGDIILAIDGVDMTKTEKVEGETYGRSLSNYVSSHLKGQPGTTITIKVERLGEKKPLTFKVTREKISMDIIPYYGIVADGVGYINLTTFTNKSAAEVKEAFMSMKKEGITSLVFDVRSNGGGVLEDAVQIVNMFVPKGKVVLSTKGKLKQWDRTYRTTLEPIDMDIPLVVLVDKNSASASEILAGSLQDMDRAVLIGERTFGKGLVQSPRELPYNSSFKLTTSKYYIPSGRCVQAIDYSHRNADGSVARTPDSLTTVFHTEIGRPVRDGGGVTPDITLGEEKVVTICYYLENQFIVFDWVSNWMLKHKTIAPAKEFTITDADYEDFKAFVKSKDFEYDRMSEKSMQSLKEVMEFEGYMKTAEAEFKALEAMLKPDLERDLEIFKEDIVAQINEEIAKRYYYQKGQYIVSLRRDSAVKKALEVLANPDEYRKILSAPENKENN